MMGDLICGIDSGLSGALGFVNLAGESIGVHDIPVLPTTNGRQQIDADELASLLRGHAYT